MSTIKLAYAITRNDVIQVELEQRRVLGCVTDDDGTEIVTIDRAGVVDTETVSTIDEILVVGRTDENGVWAR